MMRKNRPSTSQPNERLKQARLLRGWSQADVAGRIGTDGYTVHRWERGRTTPCPHFRQKLCDLFGTSVVELGLIPPSQEVPAPPFPTVPLSLRSQQVCHWLVPHLRNPFFTGREAFLDTLHQMLHVDHVVAFAQSYVLHGLGGIGKTQIALEYAYRYALDYRAVFWIEAETSESILASLGRIAASLQLPERGDTEQQRMVAAVQHWLTTNGTWLLVWDNVEDPDVLLRFLPPVYYGAILITTRSQTLGTVAQCIEVPPMTHEEGIRFTLRRAHVLGEVSPNEQIQLVAQRHPHEYAAASELVQVMGGLPLALDQVGAYIDETRCGVAQYLQRFAQHRTQLLDRRGTPANNHPHSVVTTFALACTQVKRRNPLAAEILCLSAFLSPDAIPEEMLTAHALVDTSLAADPFQVDQAFAVLHAFSLVQRQPGTRTFSLPRLVQVVLQQGMSAQERADTHQRVLQRLLTLFPDASYSVREQCERLLPHVLICIDQLPDNAGGEILAALLPKVANYLRECERHKLSERLYQRALHILEQGMESNYPLLSQTLQGLGLLSNRQGKYEQARTYYERALHLREQVFGPEHPLVAQSLNVLGIYHAEQGRYEQAEALYQRALHILEQALGPENSQIARQMNNLAELSSVLGKYEQAEAWYERALQMWTESLGPDALQRWYALDGLGTICVEQGKHLQAETCYREALHLLERWLGPEDLYVSSPLSGLARLACVQGRYEEAEALYQRALAIRTQHLGQDHPETAQILNGIAHLCVHQEEEEQAEAWYKQALCIQEQWLGSDHPERAQILVGLAQLYEKQRKEEQAEKLFQEAGAIFAQRLGKSHPRTIHARNTITRLHEQRENVRRPVLDGSPVQEVASPPLSKDQRRASVPPLVIVVRGNAEQAAYTRTVSSREVTITCTVCGQTVTQFHYPSRRILYCSETCRALKQAQMQEERVRRQREKRQVERERSNQAGPPAGV